MWRWRERHVAVFSRNTEWRVPRVLNFVTACDSSECVEVGGASFWDDGRRRFSGQWTEKPRKIGTTKMADHQLRKKEGFWPLEIDFNHQKYIFGDEDRTLDGQWVNPRTKLD